MHDKSKIDEILSYAVGRNVPVVDAFRLGKLKHYAEQSEGNASDVRPRPILVKLGCAWNHRVVLLAKRKLQEFESGKFYVRADMSKSEPRGGGTGRIVNEDLIEINECFTSYSTRNI